MEYGGLLKSDLIKKLKSSDIQLNKYAETIFSSRLFKVSNQSQLISIVITSIQDLGFSKGATIPQIKNSLNSHGLSECPIDIAPYLRLHLNNQIEIMEESKNQSPPGSLTVFSKPLVDDDDFPKGFYLRKVMGKLCLRGFCCSLDFMWNPKDKLVFKQIK